MAKISDKDVQKFFDEINTSAGDVKTVEPAFQKYRQHFLRDIDWDVVQKFNPKQLIEAARTQEELFMLREHLEEKWGRNHSWWQDYHEKRIELGHTPSFYGQVEDTASGKRRGLWGVPVGAQEYIRNENIAGLQGTAVDRRIFSRFGTWEQVTGQRKLFNRVDTPDGPVLRKWTGIKPPTLKSNISRNAFVFDIETTGLIGKDASIISTGFLNTRTGKLSGEYAAFDQTKKYADAIEAKILPQWRRGLKESGQSLISEKQLIKNTISDFKTAVARGDTLMGYNIKQFDIPKIYESAKKYGLHKEFQSAIKGANIVDVAEFTVPFLSKHLGDKFVGWEAAETGLKPLGWQLEVVAESLGYKSKNAHEAKADVAMTRFVWDSLQNEKKASATFKQAVSSGKYQELVKRQTGRELLPIASTSGKVDFSSQMLSSEAKYTRPFQEHLIEKFPNVIKAKPPIQTTKVANIFAKPIPLVSKHIKGATVGRALGYAGSFAVTNMIWPGDVWKAALGGVAFDAASYATRSKGNLKKYAFGAAAFGAVNLLFGAFPDKSPQIDFSSGAKDIRPIKKLSEAGDSPTSIMGVPISPEILSFRTKILDDPNEKNKLEARLKEAQNAAQEEIGDFEEEDVYDSDLSDIQGLNQSNQNLREVNLDKFRVEVEDADTLLLHRKGLNLDNPIQIRLSGVDAPETSGHSNDPMEEVRIWQQQAGGEESSKRLEEMINQQSDLRLVIDSKEKTYGRSLGVLVGDQGKNLSLEMVSKGVVAALPFGSSEKDVISRRAVAAAEQNAVSREEGIWGFARYKAIKEASSVVGRPITYNVLTEKTKLGENLNLGAYGSFLQSFGSQQRSLTAEETSTARRLGGSLKKRFGRVPKSQRFSGKDDACNTIEGLRHGGFAERIRKELTEFGSGWDAARAMARKIYKGMDDQSAFDKFRRSELFTSAISKGIKSGGKQIGESGVTATAYEYVAKIGKEELPFVVKDVSAPSLLPKAVGERLTKQTLKGEFSSLEKLGELNAPSLYGKGEKFGLPDNAVVMEKLVGKEISSEAGISLSEAKELYSFTKKAHGQGIRHTDMHTGNIMRVTNREKKETLAVLDWGMANRFTNGYSGEWAKNENMIQKAAKDVFGKKISGKEFEEIFDVNKIYEQYSKNIGDKMALEDLNSYHKTLIYGKESQKVESTKNFFRHNVIANKVLSGGSVKRVAKRDYEMADIATAKTEIDIGSLKTEIGLEDQWALIAERKAASKRMRNFNRVSEEAVGIGLKSAHNAGSQHNTFSTIV